MTNKKCITCKSLHDNLKAVYEYYDYADSHNDVYGTDTAIDAIQRIKYRLLHLMFDDATIKFMQTIIKQFELPVAAPCSCEEFCERTGFFKETYIKYVLYIRYI